MQPRQLRRTGPSGPPEGPQRDLQATTASGLRMTEQNREVEHDVTMSIGGTHQ